MSINLNQVVICGRLTRDPELKALPSGMSICNLSIATNHIYTTKDKEKKESVEYHNVVLFGKQAENTAKFLNKGAEALVTGRLQTQSWEKDGVKHYRTEVVGDSIQFGTKQPQSSSPQSQEEPSSPTYGEDVENSDDIPY